MVGFPVDGKLDEIKRYSEEDEKNKMKIMFVFHRQFQLNSAK
jgi:hypothetical protein